MPEGPPATTQRAGFGVHPKPVRQPQSLSLSPWPIVPEPELGREAGWEAAAASAPQLRLWEGQRRAGESGW